MKCQASLSIYVDSGYIVPPFVNNIQNEIGVHCQAASGYEDKKTGPRQVLAATLTLF